MLMSQKLSQRRFLCLIVLFVSTLLSQVGHAQGGLSKLPSEINTDLYDEIAFIADTAGKQFFLYSNW